MNKYKNIYIIDIEARLTLKGGHFCPLEIGIVDVMAKTGYTIHVKDMCIRCRTQPNLKKEYSFLKEKLSVYDEKKHNPKMDKKRKVTGKATMKIPAKWMIKHWSTKFFTLQKTSDIIKSMCSDVTLVIAKGSEMEERYFRGEGIVHVGWLDAHQFLERIEIDTQISNFRLKGITDIGCYKDGKLNHCAPYECLSIYVLIVRKYTEDYWGDKFGITELKANDKRIKELDRKRINWTKLEIA